jgi:hypothetical protein
MRPGLLLRKLGRKANGEPVSEYQVFGVPPLHRDRREGRQSGYAGRETGVKGVVPRLRPASVSTPKSEPREDGGEVVSPVGFEQGAQRGSGGVRAWAC